MRWVRLPIDCGAQGGVRNPDHRCDDGQAGDVGMSLVNVTVTQIPARGPGHNSNEERALFDRIMRNEDEIDERIEARKDFYTEAKAKAMDVQAMKDNVKA